MELIKTVWQQADIKEFNAYLQSLKGSDESIYFEQKIVNTSYPCLAIKAPIINQIVSKIYKGNFISFIDLQIKDSHPALIITGKLIAKIKDFNLFKEYLLKYLAHVDSWAGTDALKLKIPKNLEQCYFNLASELVLRSKPFYRRMGLIILFKLVSDKYINSILKICNSLYNESNYYVNMANAWLVCDCFIKQREKTLKLLQNKSLNVFTQNKAISKCRDSFRVTSEDKELLKTLRI